MSAVKWIAAFIFGLAGLASLALAVLSAPIAAPVSLKASLEPVSLRPLPMFVGRAIGGSGEPAPAKEPALRGSLDAGLKAPEKPLEAGLKAPPDAGVKVVAAPAPVRGGASPAPAPGPAPVAATGAGDGVMNLQASDTADIYVDGRKVGSSPVMGFKTRAGPHKVRFDCYDAAGNAVTGPVKLVTVTAEKDQDIEFTCAEAQ